ncbi:cupin [Variovorax sp. JS1663]|nr:cupin [Variovorax sp. JS1663]
MGFAHAQPAGIGRTDILQHELGRSGQEIIQARVDFAPGAVSANHSHPGVEVAYVLEGTLEYQVEGQAPVTLQAGQALYIPAGANHLARNVGTVKAAELATYVVAKGKPLIVPAK